MQAKPVHTQKLPFESTLHYASNKYYAQAFNSTHPVGFVAAFTVHLLSILFIQAAWSIDPEENVIFVQTLSLQLKDP